MCPLGALQGMPSRQQIGNSSGSGWRMGRRPAAPQQTSAAACWHCLQRKRRGSKRWPWPWKAHQPAYRQAMSAEPAPGAAAPPDLRALIVHMDCATETGYGPVRMFVGAAVAQ
eukprot:365428-Chlamydomonas_euryale.AAC.11